MHVTAIIAAGGRGRRFGGERPKQLLSIGGRPILERSVTAFLSHPAVNEVIVALPQALVDDPPDYLRSAAPRHAQGIPISSRDDAVALHGSGTDGVSLGKPLRIVAGGERRQDSVANAFRAAHAMSDIIVIHDAARPFASADLIARTIAAAAETGAALAAVQARDTVKRATVDRTGATNGTGDGPAEAGRYVRETIARETIYLAQTPQAFRRDVLERALDLGARDPLEATDEAALVERAGLPVRLVGGEASNIKITTPDDLAMAEVIAAEQPGILNPQSAIWNPQSATRDPQSEVLLPARTGRAGTGYDLHRLLAGRPLVIGGVTIPADRGALGHSDADVVCHAVIDAILGAACLGDIGRHFPDSDPRWKDASSIDLLAHVAALVRDAGFEVGNVDVTVILETPKIRDHVDAMRAAVARAIGMDAARVSIKGKTNEGVDAVGRGEAIAAHAIALLRSISH